MSWDKTSLILQNVKGQKFVFYLKRSKYVHFLLSSKTKYMCQFLLLMIFTLICWGSHAFFCFCAITFMYDETQFFLFKAVFSITGISDFQICSFTNFKIQ